MRKTHQEALKTLCVLHHSSSWGVLSSCLDTLSELHILESEWWMHVFLLRDTYLWGTGLTESSRAYESFRKGPFTLQDDLQTGEVLELLAAFLFPLGVINWLFFFFHWLGQQIVWVLLNTLMPPQLSFCLFSHITDALCQDKSFPWNLPCGRYNNKIKSGQRTFLSYPTLSHPTWCQSYWSRAQVTEWKPFGAFLAREPEFISEASIGSWFFTWCI